MITRAVYAKTKPGRAKELCRKLHEDVLHILKSHPGFIDEIVLIADHDKDQVLALSFWKSKADAEDFQKKHYRHISEMIEHLTHAKPEVHIYDVETSTLHHIGRGKAEPVAAL